MFSINVACTDEVYELNKFVQISVICPISYNVFVLVKGEREEFHI
jgi:hypothetical protein